MSEIQLKDVMTIDMVDVSERDLHDKDGLFCHVAQMFFDAGYVTDVKGYIDALYEREKQGTTYMETNLVMPHGKADAVVKAGVAICRFQPMPYDEGTDQVAKVAVALAIPGTASGTEYIHMLAKVACLLLDEKVHDLLFTSDSAEEITQCMVEKLKEKEEER